MKPAPTKTQRLPCLVAPLKLVDLSNPLLERMQSAFAQQTHELRAAFSSVSGLVEVPFAVPTELLEEIDIACAAARSEQHGVLPTLTRC